MVGGLSSAQRRCLEGRVASDPKQTARRHASLILISNAWGKADVDTWESLVLKHLKEVDRSDPALCYRLALHLGEQGPRRSAEVIRWAELAMENARSRWTDGDFTDKMYALHKLRTKAASELWWVYEQRRLKDQSTATRDATEKYRGLAKNFAKEWFLYARRAGKDTTEAIEMCRSAAGGLEFCKDA